MKNELIFKGEAQKSEDTSTNKNKRYVWINKKDYLIIINQKNGYDTLIQKVIPKKLRKIMGATIVDIKTELKMKISRIKNLKAKN